MTTTLRPYTEAEALADAILKPSGSNLRNYTMDSTRDAILAAAQHGIDKARAEPLEYLRYFAEFAALNDDGEDPRFTEMLAKSQAFIAKAIAA